jgi:putative membrane protein
MPMFYTSIQALPDFLLFFSAATALTVFYLFLYTLSTTHNEFELIRQNNVAAAASLGLSLTGFALPLSSAIVNAKTVIDLLVYGLVAMAIQILVYWLVRLLLPNLSRRIGNGEVASALFLGAASLAAGVLTAASMVF